MRVVGVGNVTVRFTVVLNAVDQVVYFGVEGVVIDIARLLQFMDEFLAAGMIPMSLIRWEMTGFDDEIKELW